jgi:hypothetical protein
MRGDLAERIEKALIIVYIGGFECVEFRTVWEDMMMFLKTP